MPQKWAQPNPSRMSPTRVQMGREFDSPFYDCSSVLGTNYLGFEWFVPKTGFQSLNGPLLLPLRAEM